MENQKPKELNFFKLTIGLLLVFFYGYAIILNGFKIFNTLALIVGISNIANSNIFQKSDPSPRKEQIDSFTGKTGSNMNKIVIGIILLVIIILIFINNSN